MDRVGNSESVIESKLPLFLIQGLQSIEILKILQEEGIVEDFEDDQPRSRKSVYEPSEDNVLIPAKEEPIYEEIQLPNNDCEAVLPTVHIFSLKFVTNLQTYLYAQSERASKVVLFNARIKLQISIVGNTAKRKLTKSMLR